MATNSRGVPGWLAVLDDQDRQFLRRFLLASGSLKALAEEYGVSYPTVRGRLDRLIAKVKEAEAPEPADPFERHLRLLLADGRVSPPLARELLDAYNRARRESGGAEKEGGG